MTWKCKKCGKEFDVKLIGHGDLVGNPVTGFKDVPCDGELVHVSKPYYKLRKEG